MPRSRRPIVATGFNVPSAVAFNPSGELYAVAFAEGRVIKVDVATGHLQVLADIDGLLDNLAFDAKGRLFTSALADGQLLTMTPGRRLRALNPSGFIAPGGVAVGPDGQVWVADTYSLRRFGSSRNPDLSSYAHLSPPDPADADTVSADGDSVITTGTITNSVQVRDARTGHVLQDFRTLAVPVNAIRFGDTLAVAQVGAGDVVDALAGTELLGGLLYPLGLATDGHTLYLSDGQPAWCGQSAMGRPSSLPLAFPLPKASPSTATICSSSRKGSIASRPSTVRRVRSRPSSTGST